MMFANTATCCDSHPLGSSSTDGTGIWSMMGVWGFHGDFMGISWEDTTNCIQLRGFNQQHLLLKENIQIMLHTWPHNEIYGRVLDPLSAHVRLT